MYGPRSYGLKMTSGMFPRPVPTSDRQPFVRHDFLGLISSWVPVMPCVVDFSVPPSFPFPFSHVLLVVNSSTNMIIYCSLNRTFRVHLVKMVE